jgi:hypothetical protein
VNRLTKAQEAKRDDLVKRLNEAKGDVQVAYDQMASFISDDLNGKIAQYNEIVGEMETFRDELVGDMENYFDDKSEKWQEGDSGSEYQAWKSSWEELDVTEVDTVTVPDELTMGHAEELEGMEGGVGG